MALAVLLTLLVLTPTAAAWTQLRGDGPRSSTATLPGGPLDVLATRPLLPNGSILGGLVLGALGPGLVDTPHGWLGIGYDPSSGVCTLLRIQDPLAGEIERVELDTCSRGSVQAYDPVRDQVLVCSLDSRDGAVFQARDPATGELLWGLPPAPTATQTRTAEDGPPWFCGGAAVDAQAGVAVVPSLSFIGPPDEFVPLFPSLDHVISWIDLDQGAHRSTHTVPGFSFADPGMAGSPEGVCTFLDPPEDACLRDGMGADFWPMAVTTTAFGFVATGIVMCPGCDLGWETAAAWGSEAGIVGTLTARSSTYWIDEEDRSGRQAPVSGSIFAASDGRLASFTLGGRAVLVNPQEGSPLAAAELQTMDPPPRGGTFTAGPAWLPDELVLPLRQSITAVDPLDLSTRWPWSHEPDWVVGDILASTSGFVHALTGPDSLDPSPDEGVLAVLDVDDGRVVQVLPIPVAGIYRFPGSSPGEEVVDHPVNLHVASTPRLVPLDGIGLAVVDHAGNLTILGPRASDGLPVVTPGSSYPGTGEPVTLTLTPATNTPLREIRVAWGDGGSNILEPDQPATHTYTDGGDYEVRATLVHQDGTTATGTTTIHVGATPPPETNLVETAFQRENQDLTFGLLGIAVALGGGLVAVGRRRSRRSRLERELEAIDQAYNRTRPDPPQCEHALRERRAHVQGLALDGKLDEGQVSLLERRIDELGRELRLTALDDRFSFLPHGMVVALRDMLADGRISSWEREHVLRALEEDEVLTQEQKETVRELVDGWFQRDTGVAGR